MKNQSAANLSSLANKYGVAMKENAALGSIGMNPNLNIEDEYIENLLKQIHFMNMEIKLIKEKQAKSDGNALWGVINRTGQPYISNIVQSSKKYEEMRRSTNSVISRLEKEIACLANEQGAIMAEINFLESQRAKLGMQREEWGKEYESKQMAMEEKIKQQKHKLQSIRCEIKKEEEKHKNFSRDYQTIVDEENSYKMKLQKERIQIENDEKIEQMMEREKDAEIDMLKNSINKLEELFSQNVDYLKASDDQEILRKKINTLDQGLAHANFEFMQLQESIKMADYDREKEIKERKQVTENFEQTKTMLQEILLMNLMRKDKESENKKKQSVEICSAEEQTQRLSSSLEQIKSKLVKSEELHHKLKCETHGYERELGNEKKKQEEIRKKYGQSIEVNEKRESSFLEMSTQIRILEDQCEKIMTEETNSSQDLFQLEKEIEFLKTRKELLQESMELKEVMEGLRVQDLQRVVQKNNDLNSTVSSLMSKWDEIKSFSRI